MSKSGVPSFKVLQSLVNQRLIDLQTGAATPGSSAPIGASWLNRPGFTSGPVDTKNSSVVLPNGQKVRYADYSKLPADTRSLLDSVARIQREAPKQEHHSLLGTIWHDVEKPFKGLASGFGSEYSKIAEKGFYDKSLGSRLKEGLGAFGHGFKEGWQGKDHTSGADLIRLINKNAEQNSPKWLGIKDEPVSHSRVGQAVLGLGVDVGLDPLSYFGVGGLTKVKNLARTANDIKKAKEVQKTLFEAGHEADAAIAPKVLLGSKDIKEGWLSNRIIPNSRQRAETMGHAINISHKYGEVAFERAFKENLVKAEEQLSKQGIRQFNRSGFGLREFRKFYGNSKLTQEELSAYNASVRKDIERLAGQLTGDSATFIRNKSEELMSLASKNNLMGDAAKASEDFKKALSLKFAGKNVVKVSVPKAVSSSARKVFEHERLSNVRDFTEAMHSKFDTIFRTGSHIDPFVNALRQTRHSSIVEKMNNHVVNENSIWGNVNPKMRKEVADDVTQGLTNVAKAGGKNLITGEHITDLVAHTNSELKHLESLVGKGKLVTQKQFLAALPSNYSFPSEYFKHDDWLKTAWRDHYLGKDAAKHLQHLGKDPAVFLLTMRHAILSAAADRELPHQISSRFGHTLYKVDENGKKVSYSDPVVQGLKKTHNYRTPSIEIKHGKKQTIHGYEGKVFHPEVATAIEKMFLMSKHQSELNKGIANPMLKTFSSATQMFKSVVTKYNPGFHERNLLGEMASSAADGVLTIGPYRKALQVLRLHGQLALDTGKDLGKKGARVHNAILPDAYSRARIAKIDGNGIIIKKRFADLKSEGVTADQLWHAYVENGIKTGFITTEFGKYVGHGGHIGTSVNAKVQHLTENIEDYTRLAHFISRIERSKQTNFVLAAEEAAGYVKKFHFDYNDFTHAEKTVLSRVIPFYRWTRKNIPLQMALLAQRPAYFLTQMKALNAISQGAGFGFGNNDIPTAEAIMPSWLREHLAVPVGMGSSGVRYLDAPLPTKDAFNFFGTGPQSTLENAAFMVNPMIKNPIEVATRHQIGGAPIQGDRYLAGQTPYSNLINNLLNKNNTGKTTNLLQFLVGLGFQENTPARIKSELKREQSAASAARKKYRAQHHMLPLGN